MNIDNVEYVPIGKETSTFITGSIDNFYVEEVLDNHYIELVIGKNVVSYTDVFHKVLPYTLAQMRPVHYGINNTDSVLSQLKTPVRPGPPFDKEMYHISFFKNEIRIPSLIHDNIRLFTYPKGDRSKRSEINFYVSTYDPCEEHVIRYHDCVVDALRVPNILKIDGYEEGDNVLRFMSGMGILAYNGTFIEG